MCHHIITIFGLPVFPSHFKDNKKRVIFIADTGYVISAKRIKT